MKTIGLVFPDKKRKAPPAKAGGAAPDVKVQETGATQDPPKEEK